MIDDKGNEFPPCAWCGMDEMDVYASFNGGDICIDCADEESEEEEEEGDN